MIENYLKRYKEQFESEHHLMSADGDGGHHHHNPDPEYWAILLGDVKFNPDKWEGKNAFDFGCGCGRNLVNLSTLANWKNIDGCDISKSNSEYAKKWFDKTNTTSAVSTTWENNGIDIQPISHKYDFIMSHIVFQHISNYDVRFNIITDMFNSLNEGGLCSLHFMDLGVSAPYPESNMEYKNCRVENEQYLIDDFNKIGFNNVRVSTGRDYLTGVRSYYIKGEK
jgi:2-polyprenyl-3-methyl-5-hydroxy-6-metoxy-1,4-benzoquinol methylase